MITQAAVDKARMYIESGIAEGATLAVDGRGFKMQGYEKGFYLGSCLFDNVTEDMRIYKEEIFAPVLSVLRAKSYDEALRLCNDHEYGNGVAIFTRDGDAARDFVSKVQVGMVGVNVPIPTPLAYYCDRRGDDDSPRPFQHPVPAWIRAGRRSDVLADVDLARQHDLLERGGLRLNRGTGQCTDDRLCHGLHGMRDDEAQGAIDEG